MLGLLKMLVTFVSSEIRHRFLGLFGKHDEAIQRFDQLPKSDALQLLRDLEATPNRPDLNKYLESQFDHRRTIRRHRTWLNLQERLDRRFSEVSLDLQRPVDVQKGVDFAGDDADRFRRVEGL